MKFDVEKFVKGLHDYFAKELKPLISRLKELEKRIQERGEKGLDGKDGKDGLNGKDGKDGINGEKGLDGKDGKDGLNGKDGKDGINGEKGLDGKIGERGEKGEAGERGEKGLDGKIGERGENGEAGERGEKGLDGKIGERGEKGEAGERGEKGLDGKDGKDGLNGKDGKDGINGEKGLDGKIGERGEKGEAGERGEKGLDGKIGERGENGEAGERGEKGLDGKIGERGEKGEAGERGEKGLDGKNGLDGKSISEAEIEKMVQSRVNVLMLDFERRAQDILQKAIAAIPKPKDGAAGADGFGFEDLSAVMISEKQIKITFKLKDRQKEFILDMPIVVDAGVYKEGKDYTKGDGVTYGGSFWIAQVDHPAKSPGQSSDWRLAVKRGRDAKELKIMNMIVTRAQAASHLRIDDPDAEGDDLDLKIAAASGVVLDYLEMDIADFGDSDSDGPPEIPEQIKAATLLLVGEMHRSRDGGSQNFPEATLPSAVRALLYPLKTWGLSWDD